jgi:hypothetical protein
VKRTDSGPAGSATPSTGSGTSTGVSITSRTRRTPAAAVWASFEHLDQQLHRLDEQGDEEQERHELSGGQRPGREQDPADDHAGGDPRRTSPRRRTSRHRAAGPELGPELGVEGASTRARVGSSAP